MSSDRARFPLLFALIAIGLFATVSLEAHHAWSTYHWKRSANPFTVMLGNNLTTPEWQGLLNVVASDWSQSLVLDAALTAGGTRPRNCKPSRGRVEVCNARYGFNGWLGLAQIWLSGGHIVQGTAKVNDSYFDTNTYDQETAKRHVLCQEIGHTFGLDHQTTASCMNDSGGSLFDPAAVDPDSHDYEQLEAIYAHLDGASPELATLTEGTGENGETAGDDAIPTDVRRRRIREFSEVLPNGLERITFIFWAP